MRDWHAYVRARLAVPGLRPEREARVVRELAAQLDDFYREALARGLDEAAADAHACAQIRDWDGLALAVRTADAAHARPRLERAVNALESHAPAHRPGGFQMFADVLNDVRYALRQLTKTPGFTVVAVLTLAFGVGATSAIFSVVNSVLLKPLPYPDAASLIRVYERVPSYGRFAVAPATFLDWREQNTVFSAMATYGSSTATLDLGAGPERIPGSVASADLFDVLGVAPALGRPFNKAEDAPGKNGVVVLSHGMWQTRFGADPGVLGRTITMSGEPAVIVGVMPQGFYFPTRDTQYWRPIALPPAPTRGGHYLGVIARLKTGVPLQQAHTEMAAISERLATQYPENSADESAEAISLHDQVVGPIRPMLITLFAAVFVVVLIACANVANLLLVRASVREKEIAIRAAMGAGRRRLLRQMLTESLVLAIAGGALGILLAYFAIAPIQTLSAGSIPRAADIALDGRVLAFAFVLSILTGVLFGLAPAWQASRAGLGAVLKEGGRSSSTTGGRWMRNALLVAEVALSIVLLVGATLLIRSFSELSGVDPGFKADNVLAFQVSLPQVSYPEDHNRIAFYDGLLDRLRNTPGVESAGMVQTLPLRGGYVLSFSVEGRPPARPGEEPSANHRVVSPDYFSTLGIPLLRGRALSASDTVEAPMVAVIDQAFVDKYFPNEDPIGRGIDIGNGTDGAYRIVGVVGDVKYEGLEATTDPTMYVPHKQDVFGTMWVLARTSGDPSGLIATARQTVREIDPSLPAYSLTPLADVVRESVAERRFSMLLLGLFAGVALFLAAVGLYGVVSYTVSQRTQEIGLRMAIGAEPGQVMRMVVGGGMKLALLGVALGIAAALGLANLVASMLFGVTPFDPVSYAVTAGLLLIVAAVACYVPARRAMRVDPIIAMRHQ